MMKQGCKRQRPIDPDDLLVWEFDQRAKPTDDEPMIWWED
jgi:hypothetical protein